MPRNVMWALVAAGLMMAFVTKRFGLRAALAVGGAAVGLHVLVDQRRRRGRRGGGSGGAGDVLGGASVEVIIRGFDGRITRVSRNHLALMMREGDFTADDYELLLRLDDDVHKPATDHVEKVIALLPARTYAPAPRHQPGAAAAAGPPRAPGGLSPSASAGPATSTCAECCVVCLSDYAAGDQIKTLPCLHEFHAHCADAWLRHKPRCPVCVADIGC